MKISESMCDHNIIYNESSYHKLNKKESYTINKKKFNKKKSNHKKKCCKLILSMQDPNIIH